MCIDEQDPEKKTNWKSNENYVFGSRFSVIILVVYVQFRGQSTTKYYALV